LRSVRTSWLAAALAFALALGAAACGRGAHCEQCGRAECRNMTFHIRLASGKEVGTCCPRCGLHYLAQQPAAVAELAVHDFDSAERLEAERAYYVEGSDVTPCSATPSATPRDERGCCLKPVYDRCLPSLIAFHSRPRAESFSREHGGEVRTFQELQAAQHRQAAPANPRTGS
jgi:hypothetical protein